MRQIALDTETTGLSTEDGHRIIEIGCVEIINRRITDHHFHCYINPERTVHPGALAIHGLSNEFLKDKPKFNEIFSQFIDFVDGAELIIHNAPFDVGFINYELSLLGHAKLLTDHCRVFDTLMLARQLHPGQKNNLDALCKRHNIDNSHRQLHGALLDANLVAEAYIAMRVGQVNLFPETENRPQDEQAEIKSQLIRSKPLPVGKLTDIEQQAHLEFVELLRKSSGSSLWDDEL